MTPLVVGVVLFAAVTHAGWNAITHRIKDELACLSLVGAGRTLCGAVLACLAPLPAPAAWPYLIASVLIHIAYQVALMRSFRLGDFGQVYPIARGSRLFSSPCSRSSHWASTWTARARRAWRS